MRITEIKAALMVAAALVLGAGTASAASVTNTGDKSVVIIVVEAGKRASFTVDAGASQSICGGGCFVTLPNGDRLGLLGDEQIDIKNGSATVK